MNFDELRKAITNRFMANWAGTDLSRVVYGDNSAPLNTADDDLNNGAWCRLSFSVVDCMNAAVGTDFQRAIGIISLQIFTKLNSGEKQSLDLVKSFADVFENKQFNGVTCYVVSPVTVGRSKTATGESYQKNAKVRFEFDEIS